MGDRLNASQALARHVQLVAELVFFPKNGEYLSQFDRIDPEVLLETCRGIENLQGIPGDLGEDVTYRVCQISVGGGNGCAHITVSIQSCDCGQYSIGGTRNC